MSVESERRVTHFEGAEIAAVVWSSAPILFAVSKQPTLDLLFQVAPMRCRARFKGRWNGVRSEKESATRIAVIADGDDEMFWVGHELGVVQINWAQRLKRPRNVEKLRL